VLAVCKQLALQPDHLDGKVGGADQSLLSLGVSLGLVVFDRSSFPTRAR
jgi:hypothetical protein